MLTHFEYLPVCSGMKLVAFGWIWMRRNTWIKRYVNMERMMKRIFFLTILSRLIPEWENDFLSLSCNLWNSYSDIHHKFLASAFTSKGLEYNPSPFSFRETRPAKMLNAQGIVMRRIVDPESAPTPMEICLATVAWSPIPEKRTRNWTIPDWYTYSRVRDCSQER